MLFLESKTPEEKKEWVKYVVNNLVNVYQCKKPADLDQTFDLPPGSVNTMISRGGIRPALDMAMTAAKELNLSLGSLVFDIEESASQIKAQIESGLFKAHDIGLIAIDYQIMTQISEIILIEMKLTSAIKKAG